MTTKKARAPKPLLERYKLVPNPTNPDILDLMIDEYYVISLRADGTFSRIGAIGSETGVKLDRTERIVENK